MKAVELARFVAILAGMAAAASSSEELNFVIMGDWGGQDTAPFYTTAEKEIAQEMGMVAAAIGSQFTVALGDNFYGFGVKDVDDPRFQETFENVFTADSLQSRWYVICGNHDHYGNASAEIAYTDQSKRWYMPDFYYTETMKIPGTTSTVQFVFIDTVILTGLTDPEDRTLPPLGPISQTRADQQWVWIEKTLQESTADWIIVAGHYPVWSVAEHGPTANLVQNLRPLLEKYKVTAYFCGHDHTLQYIKESNSSVNYIVTGAGHVTDADETHKTDIPKDSLKFHYAPDDPGDTHGGFTSVSIAPTNMTITFYDYTGKPLYVVRSPKLRQKG